MNPKTRRTLHLISQAHLDPVWLWPRRDGVAEVLTTFQSAVDRLKENPTFRFSRSSSCAYEWVREADPRLFGEIRALVQEGRWEVVGGWFEQPDCNLPSAESFLRQAEVAREFFDAEFGPSALTPCGYNVDSFGHCGGLPQLLRRAGLDAYAFMRPEPWSNPDVPLLFWWEAPDGSRVLAVRIPGGYSQSYSATADDVEKTVREAFDKNFAPGMHHGVMWFGVGNHGGGPTREHIARILELQAATADNPEVPEIRFSTLREFLASARASSTHLPVLRGELGYVFRGCYSANGTTKRQHRAAEKSLFVAESLASMETVLTPGTLPSRNLQEAWRDLLFLQFHDILAGTCVAQVQEEITDRFGRVLTTARDAAEMSTLRLGRRVDTSAETGSVLLACNPLPWARTARISLDTFVKIHAREEVVALETASGEVLPLQWLPADANFGPWGLEWGKLTALVPLPASGYRVLRLQTRSVAPPAYDPFDNAEGPDEDNPQFSGGPKRQIAPAVIYPTPALETWTTPCGSELLQAPIRCAIASDTGGTWGHARTSYKDHLTYPTCQGHEILVEGPVLSLTREKSTWGKSEIWMDILRTVGSKDLEIRLRFNWQEHRHQLKLEIPTRLTQTHCRAQMPAEVVTRPCDGTEYACHDWVELSGDLQGATASLAVCNDATYSYSAEHGVLRFTLARGVPHAEHPPFDYVDTRNIALLDQGWQERRFLLRCSTGKNHPGDLSRLAAEFQMPALGFLDSAHPGDLPWEKTGISIEPASISVLAIRPLEAPSHDSGHGNDHNHGRGLLVRVAETSGEPVTGILRFPHGEKAIALQPWEVQTLALEDI